MFQREYVLPMQHRQLSPIYGQFPVCWSKHKKSRQVGRSKELIGRRHTAIKGNGGKLSVIIFSHSCYFVKLTVMDMQYDSRIAPQQPKNDIINITAPKTIKTTGMCCVWRSSKFFMCPKLLMKITPKAINKIPHICG